MDAVITYVECDKKFEEQYEKYVKKDFSVSRFRSYHVLDLQIKLIRKYMPYIKNIFVVVSDKSQVEEYDDLSNSIIVEHSQIIPSQYLPCFNSCTIEMFLHNIPDLAEEFIYFNDDMFVINKVSQYDFFRGTQPVLSPKIKDIPSEPNVYEQQCINSTNEILKKLKKENLYKGKYFVQEHICKPYLKRTFSILWSRCREDIIYSLTRTRHKKNYNCYLFNNYDILSDNYVEKKHDYLYIELDKNPVKLKNIICTYDKQFICINDNNCLYNFNILKKKIKEALLWHLNKTENSIYIKENEIIIQKNSYDKIIVTFTSWKNRINSCIEIFNKMKEQTLLPDKVILNLSYDEFPNKENDLPKELIEIINENESFEIYWVKENYKQFKKLSHTLNRFPKDIIISIDDDFPYPDNFIETLYSDYIKINYSQPISYSNFKDINNLYTHHGSFTITQAKFYGNYINEILNEFIYPNFNKLKCYDDPVYTEAAKLNGYLYKMGSINYNEYRLKIHKDTIDAISKRDENYQKDRKEYLNKLFTFIENKYKLFNTKTDEKIIVSLTSYPARIKYVKDVLYSLVNQKVEKKLYHIVLVLALPEFPNKEKDLPEDLNKYIKDNKNLIEIIWHPTNIRSHKKLMPTLQKYPNNPILICDDDVYRPQGWLQMFIEDHIKYPNDIIFGTSSWYFGNNYKLKRFTQFKCKSSGSINNLPEQIFKTAKPANGLGGCLYPKNTFTDKRFFSEDLMMTLSPTSDESWQYCFNIIENKTFRQTSKIIDYSEYFLDGTQEIETSLHKINNYTNINNLLFTVFPEFKLNLNKRMKEFIVSFTTHGPRVKYINKTLNSILNQTLKPYKIVITLYKDDEKYLLEETKNIISTNKIIDLIICDKKLGPHTKYFYSMQKYKNYAVITVDDDHEYPEDLCESLWKSYINNPNLISARRVHLIQRDESGNLLPYNSWKYNCKSITNSDMELFPTGVGGVIYPPDILKISDKNLPDIYNCLYADDIYLKWLEKKMGISTIWCKNNNTEGIRLEDTEILNSALYKINGSKDGENRNDKYLKIFKL